MSDTLFWFLVVYGIGLPVFFFLMGMHKSEHWREPLFWLALVFWPLTLAFLIALVWLSYVVGIGKEDHRMGQHGGL